MSTRKRPRVYQLRLTEDEWQQLDSHAQLKQISAAEVLREFIKTLPRQDKSCN
jgi:hypothetical protein